MEKMRSNFKTVCILVILMSGMFFSTVSAKVFIVTEIAQGKVISITKENTIELDDGFLYYPVKQQMPISIKLHEIISIRYYIDTNYERKYIDWAAGKNSLKDVPLPKTKSTTRSKKML